MAYVATPLGMRNMVNDQERMNHGARQQGFNQAHQMAMAQLQADTQRDIQGTYGQRSADLSRESQLGRKHEITRFGDFDQNAGLRRDELSMDPGYLAAQLATRRYDDQRGDDAPLRELRNRAIGGMNLDGMDPMAGLALAGGNLGQYFQHVGSQQRFDRESEQATEAKRLALAQVLMQSEAPEARQFGFQLFGGASGADLPQDVVSGLANPMAATERFAAGEAGARAGELIEDRSFFGGLGDLAAGTTAMGFAPLTGGITGAYGLPKAISGIAEMAGSVTDAIGLTGPDKEQAESIVRDMAEQTGGNPRQMKLQLQAVVAELGERINEEWAAPIRRAAAAFGALNG